MDGMTRMMQHWNTSSELSSAEKDPRILLDSPSIPPQNTTLTAEEYAFLKHQEAKGKILLHNTTPNKSHTPAETSSTHSFAFPNSEPQANTTSRIVYTINPDYTTSPNPNTTQNHNQTNTYKPDTMRDQTPSFNLTIARPKLDFPPYSGEDPYNWLR
jgi:hypothetical protein